MKNYYKVEKEIAGLTLSLETGKIAKQADGAVFAQWGNTVVLATCVYSKSKADAYSDFFPLTVNYIEKTYATGRFPGGFFKRESRPSEHEVLSSRLIDRPLRPLFGDFKNETQVVVTVLSSDGKIEPSILGVIAASAALSISEIPFDGPIAAVQMGYIDNLSTAMPTSEALKESKLNLVVAGGSKGISMVEGAADEVAEDFMIDEIDEASKIIADIVELENKLVDEVNPKKLVVEKMVPDAEVEKLVNSKKLQLKETYFKKEKEKRASVANEFKNDVINNLLDSTDEQAKQFWVNTLTDELVKSLIREKMAAEHIRLDGRKFDDIRHITCETSLLPMTHGSAVFTRGETQALVTVTLGSKDDMQLVDGLNGKYFERFMLHYNFPPYSVGEIKRLGTPGRREIGHGNLAKRAITPELPDELSFPYVVRVVSEVTESNGSSSMATVCGATLALANAGVPLRNRVSGIAMGLMKESDETIILTDITGEEDHYGDMDFKVAGSANGINAIQMDIKIDGITSDILKIALQKAKTARLYILDKINDALDENTKLSPIAPRIEIISIKQSKIKDVIGPSGKMIKEIVAKTGSKIDINDDGTVQIYSKDKDTLDATIAIVKDIARDIELGDEFTGAVTRVENYGAFVRLTPRKEGMAHISKLSNTHIKNINDVVKVGDELTVKVIGVDYAGKVSLAAKDYEDNHDSKQDHHSRYSDRRRNNDK